MKLFTNLVYTPLNKLVIELDLSTQGRKPVYLGGDECVLIYF